MSIDTFGLEWAQKFHETYERLAPQFGYETRPDTRQFESESKNGQLMIAVCGEIVRAAVDQAERAAYEKAEKMCREYEVPPYRNGWQEMEMGALACADAIHAVAHPAPERAP